MTVAIERSLNLVIPLASPSVSVEEEGQSVYVHARPIPRDVYKQHWKVLGRVHAQIFGAGYSVTTGPGVAALMLCDIATSWGIWDDVRDSLLAEMRRLTNVKVPSERGYETLPLDTAISREVISAEDADEVEGALVFFTVVWHVMPRKTRTAMLNAAGGLWGWQLTLLDATAFVASLPTLTPAASSGEPAVLSVPS